jgi:hypothetical protein
MRVAVRRKEEAMRNSLSLTVTLFASAFTLVACSGAPSFDGDDLRGSRTTSRDDDVSGKGSSGANNDLADDETQTDQGSGSDQTTPPPSGDPGQCSASTSADACYECCDAAHPGAIDVWYDAADACACQSPGVCAAQCGSDYCQGGQPSAACADCLDNAVQCLDAGDQACKADPGCAAVLACEDASLCDSKP